MDNMLGLSIDDNCPYVEFDEFEEESSKDLRLKEGANIKKRDVEILAERINSPTKSLVNHNEVSIELKEEEGAEIDDYDDDEEEEQNKKFKVIYGHYKLPKLRFSLNRRDLILGVARNLFAGYSWNSLVQLSATLMGDTRLSGITLFKYVLFALYSQDIDQIDPDDLKRFVFNFTDILQEKFEFLLEIIIFILNNETRFLCHRSFLSDLKLRILKRRRLFTLPKCRDIIFKTYRLYEEYLDFLEWKHMTDSRSVYQSQSSNIGSSILSDKIKTNLDLLLSEPTYPEMNLDIGVLMLLELFDNDNELPQALLMLDSYTEKNPDHMNGYIYLYEFLNHFPDVGEHRMKIKALKNIARLCPDSKYTLRLASELPKLTNLSPLDRVEMIGDYLDYVHNRNSRKAWKLLYKTLNEFNNNNRDDDVDHVDQTDKLRSYFECRLKFWKRIHFAISRLQPLLPQLRRFHQSRSYDSDYSSDISTASEGTITTTGFRRKFINPVPQESFSLNDYHLHVYKGKFLGQLSQLMVTLPDELTQYNELIMSL